MHVRLSHVSQAHNAGTNPRVAPGGVVGPRVVLEHTKSRRWHQHCTIERQSTPPVGISRRRSLRACRPLTLPQERVQEWQWLQLTAQETRDFMQFLSITFER